MQNFIRLATDATQDPPGNQSLVILITGFAVVFMVLLLLIGLIKVYSGIVYAAQNKVTSKAKSKEEPEQVKEPVANAASVATSPASDEVDLQTIAVITAAVETFYGGSKKVRVAGIRPVASGRNAWGSAGVMENIPSMTRGGLL